MTHLRTRRLLQALMLGCTLIAGCGTPGTAPGAEAVAAPAMVADTLNGPQVLHLPDGSTLKGSLREGVRQGIWRSFSPEGRLLSQTEYRDGRPHGPVVVFHTNGAVRYLGQHRDGVPTGEWRFHDESGALARTVAYDSTGAMIPGQ